MGLHEEIKEEIVRRVDEHPCTVRHFHDLHKSKPVIYGLLNELIQQERIRYKVQVKGGNGRPFNVYCNKKYEVFDQHELGLTTICLKLGATRCGDPELRPDAELRIPDLHYVEFHCGSMRGKKIDDRFSKYRTVGNPVLWVCLHERDISYLMERSPENHYFTTYDDVVKNGRDSTWFDRDVFSYGLIPPSETRETESEVKNVSQANDRG